MMPHLGQTELTVVVAMATGMYVDIGQNTKRRKHENSRCGCIYNGVALHLRLQACAPSDHLWSAFLLPPQFLYQAPPGAQQLTLPDFLNVLHFGHVTSLLEVMASVLVLTGVVIGARTISSRSGIGRRDTY